MRAAVRAKPGGLSFAACMWTAMMSRVSNDEQSALATTSPVKGTSTNSGSFQLSISILHQTAKSTSVPRHSWLSQTKLELVAAHDALHTFYGVTGQPPSVGHHHTRMHVQRQQPASPGRLLRFALPSWSCLSSSAPPPALLTCFLLPSSACHQNFLGAAADSRACLQCVCVFTGRLKPSLLGRGLVEERDG